MAKKLQTLLSPPYPNLPYLLTENVYKLWICSLLDKFSLSLHAQEKEIDAVELSIGLSQTCPDEVLNINIYNSFR